MGGLPNKLIPDPEPHVPQTEGSQFGDHGLSISCGVDELPDHHCGDYLVKADNTLELVELLAINRLLEVTE